jgi:Ca2+-binding RTX toxin-like protein
VRELRPDIQDHIFGGAGTQLDRNDTDAGVATSEAERHARDADVILGDNGDIIRIVGTNRVDGMVADPTKPYLTYGFDTYATPLRIVVRGVRLHDYSPFGDDFYVSNNPTSPAAYAVVTNDPRRNTNIGKGDRLWGESGDDEVHGETGADTIFGGADDDRLHGESGGDWFSGGTGTDGIVGDDGLLLTSRGGYAEPLHDMAATTQVTINPDVTVTADAHITVNITFAIIYTADLEPFFVGNHDIAYGGLGNDFIHGGAGDDALSGAEALPFYYDDGRHDPLGVLDRLAAHYTPGNVLGYDPATTLFRYYSQTDPWRKLVLRNPNGTPLMIDGKMVDFLLNFESQQTFDATTPAPVVDDGRDAIFGDVGNDWMVGGTNQDHVYGGYGDDLLQLDDNLESTKITISVTYASLCALTHSFSSLSDKATTACVYLDDARKEELKGDTTAKQGKLREYTDFVLQEVANSSSFTVDESATLTRLAQALWPRDELANNIPDPRGTGPTYADVGFGGAGRDVHILNTIQDRVYDWKSEYNTFVIPWGGDNVPGLTDAHNEKVEQFLYDLALSDGADPTRGGDILRNGEPFGELGLTRDKDADWLTQHGPRRDPKLEPRGEFDRSSLSFAVYTQSAEMVRVAQLGIGNTFPIALLHRILIRGQLTAKEEIALGSAGQTALNELISKGFVQRIGPRIQPTPKLYLLIGLADPPVILTRDLTFSGPTVTITGLGEAGNTLTLFNGAVAIGSVTVAANGTWSITVALSVGTHRLTARQSVNTPPHAGLTSNLSNLITVRRR